MELLVILTPRHGDSSFRTNQTFINRKPRGKKKKEKENQGAQALD